MKFNYIFRLCASFSLFFTISHAVIGADGMNIYYAGRGSTFTISPTSQMVMDSPSAMLELSSIQAHFVWKDFSNLLILNKDFGSEVERESGIGMVLIVKIDGLDHRYAFSRNFGEVYFGGKLFPVKNREEVSSFFENIVSKYIFLSEWAEPKK